MPHCAARSGLLIQRRNRRQALPLRLAGGLEQIEIAAAGRAAAPLVGRQHRHAERELRVAADVRQVARGGPDHRHLLLQEIARRGAPIDHARRMRVIFRAQVDPVAQRLDTGRHWRSRSRCHRRWRASRRPPSPAPGTANRQSRCWEFARPSAARAPPLRCVSFAAKSACCCQVAGGLSGSRPAARNASLFQYSTMVERWNGTPQVWPPISPFFRNAG